LWQPALRVKGAFTSGQNSLFLTFGHKRMCMWGTYVYFSIFFLGYIFFSFFLDEWWQSGANPSLLLSCVCLPRAQHPKHLPSGSNMGRRFLDMCGWVGEKKRDENNQVSDKHQHDAKIKSFQDALASLSHCRTR